MILATFWVLVCVLILVVVLALKGYGFDAPPGMMYAGLILLAAVNLLKLFIYVVLIATIVYAVLSWVSPYSPVAPILNAMTRPFVGVFRRYIPLIGGVDLSPLFVLVVCQLLLMWPVTSLQILFNAMLT